MKKHESFNKSEFSKYINSPGGRLLRLVNGLGFLALGYAKRQTTGGKISIIWGLLPLSAAIFDVCYISAVLGGPFSGKEIRALQKEPATYEEPAIVI